MTTFRRLAVQDLSLPEQLRLDRDLPPPDECQLIRDKAGVSKEQFARTLHVQPSTLKSWECARRRPQFRHRVIWSLRIQELREFLGESHAESAPTANRIDDLALARS